MSFDCVHPVTINCFPTTVGGRRGLKRRPGLIVSSATSSRMTTDRLVTDSGTWLVKNGEASLFDIHGFEHKVVASAEILGVSPSMNDVDGLPSFSARITDEIVRLVLDPRCDFDELGETDRFLSAFRSKKPTGTSRLKSVTIKVFETRQLELSAGSGFSTLTLNKGYSYSGNVKLRTLGLNHLGEEFLWTVRSSEPFTVLSVTEESDIRSDVWASSAQTPSVDCSKTRVDSLVELVSGVENHCALTSDWLEKVVDIHQGFISQQNFEKARKLAAASHLSELATALLQGVGEKYGYPSELRVTLERGQFVVSITSEARQIGTCANGLTIGRALLAAVIKHHQIHM